MTIVISTPDPKNLLKAIYTAIDNGDLKTWNYEPEKGGFTHNPPQWLDQAWLTPDNSIGKLQFELTGMKNIVKAKEIYSIYHGRFIEMLLNHFSDHFSTATATTKSLEVKRKLRVNARNL